MEELVPFSDEALRVSANLAQRHDAWVEAERRLEGLPSSMFFAKREGGREYLVVKRHSRDNGTTIGAKDSETERRLEEFRRERDEAQQALTQTEAALAEIVAQYRALKLPTAMPLPARILRELDIAGLLGTDYMAVGTNAFAVYQIEARARFASISDETEDFDLAWCRGSGISLAAMNDGQPPLLDVLRRVDPSFRINPRRPYQALDEKGYEVEVLVAPSMFRTRPEDDDFSPMAVFPEQEWLLKGRPVRHVVASRDGRTCPIFAPDPRWMALHKLWLANKPERNAAKRPKDRRQGDVLLKAVASTMEAAYPMDVDFVMDLPEELRALFDLWAKENDFIPVHDASPRMR